SFCFLSSGDHPALPSFPTRRSSDLHDARLHFDGARLRVEGQDAVQVPAVVDHQRLADRLPALAAAGAARQDRRAFLAGELDRGEDRKSTRLNSSHVKISYAVFCLKK